MNQALHVRPRTRARPSRRASSFANDTSSPDVAPFSVTFAGNSRQLVSTNRPRRTRWARSTFAADPATPFTSVSRPSEASTSRSSVGDVKVYHADLAFTVAATERTLSGIGTFCGPDERQFKSTMTVDPAHPLRIVLATGCRPPTPVAMSSTATSRLVRHQPARHICLDLALSCQASPTVDCRLGDATTDHRAAWSPPMPAIEADLRCNAAGATTADWNGVYRQIWGCLPFELGTRGSP